VSCSEEEIQREGNLPALLLSPFQSHVMSSSQSDESSCLEPGKRERVKFPCVVLFSRFVALVPLRRKGPTTYDDGSCFSEEKGKMCCCFVVLLTHADRGRSGSFSSPEIFPETQLSGGEILLLSVFRSFESVTRK